MLKPTETLSIDPSPADYGGSLKSLLHKYCGLLRGAGADIQAFTPESMERFAAYPREIQAQIYTSFVKSVTAVVDIVDNGIPLEDTERSLWCIFKKNGLRPRPDLFS